MTEQFDLIRTQQDVRDCLDPKVVYGIWESICRRYESKQITLLEFEEIKEMVMDKLKKLKELKDQINSAKGETAK